MKNLSYLYCLLLLGLVIAPASYAGIQLDATRVVYPVNKREVSLGVTNNASSPRLIQSWIEGDENVSSSQSKVPFIVMPPISRLDAGKRQTLRIVYTGGTVPRDRESVFWLNVLEVQPSSRAKKEDLHNRVQVSVRSRLKLFYRPQGLVGSPQDSISHLRWHLITQGDSYVVECENPTAFNVSFNQINFKDVTDENPPKQSGMCPAKGKQKFPMSGAPPTASGKLAFTTIDDFGIYHHHETRYSN